MVTAEDGGRDSNVPFAQSTPAATPRLQEEVSGKEEV